MKIKMIHPKTLIIREVEESNQNKINILRRAGFKNADGFRMPKKKVVEPPPTVSEVVEGHKLEEGEGVEELNPEIAIHISVAARKLVQEHDLDPAKIQGTGKDGGITKPDVVKYLAALEAEKEAAE